MLCFSCCKAKMRKTRKFKRILILAQTQAVLHSFGEAKH